MKKIVMVLLVAFTTVFLVACTTKNQKKSDNKEESSNITVENPSDKEESEIPEDIDPVDEVKTAKVPGKEIYVDYDISMRKKEEAYTTLMYQNNDSLVGLAFKKDVIHTGTLEDVIALFKTDFINDASTSSAGNLYGSEIVVKATEKTTISGFESVKFTGTALNKDEWECHVYGYTFVIEGTPCAIIGIVSAQAQDATMIAEIDAQVDKIASTIRTTE